MSVCMVIIVIITDQTSYDNFNTKADRIYRITTINTLKYNRYVDRFATTAYPLAEELTTNYTILDDAVILNRLFLGLGMYNGININIYGLYASSSFFNVFDFVLEKGNPATALVEPFSIILTEDVARKFFGTEDPMGKTFQVENLGYFKVTGILKKTEDKSHIQFEALASASTIGLLENSGKIEKTINNWNRYTNSYVYVLIKKGVKSNVLQEILDRLSEERYYNNDTTKLVFIIQPLLKIVPGPLLGAEYGYFLRAPFIIFFICLGLIIILAASFNYTSMSIALAINRAKEIGIRKTFGANRKQIIIQFIIESIIVAFISLLLAIILLQLLLPLFSMMDIINPKQTIIMYFWFFVFAVITGVLSSIIPSIFISSFNPVKIIKSGGNISISGKLTFRRTLLFLQLSVSMVFMVSIILLSKQMKLMVGVNREFDEGLVYNVELKGNNLKKVSDYFTQVSGVEVVSGASQIPGMDITHKTKVKLNEQDENIEIDDFSVDKNYITAMGLELIAGSTFPFSPGDYDEHHLIVNESFMKKFELGYPVEAIGTMVILDDSIQVSICGVIKDYKYGDLLSNVSGSLILRNRPSWFTHAVLRINPVNIELRVDRLKKAWKEIDQFHEFNGELLSDELKYFITKRTNFNNIMHMVGFTTILATLIAFIGLLGMISVDLQKRKKEICIRKVFGSEHLDLIVCILKSYLKIFLIAGIFAAPIAFFVSNLWMQNLAYRVSPGLGDIMAGIFIVIVAGFSIVYQKTKNASNINPAQQLREE